MIFHKIVEKHGELTVSFSVENSPCRKGAEGTVENTGKFTLFPPKKRKKPVPIFLDPQANILFSTVSTDSTIITTT